MVSRNPIPPACKKKLPFRIRGVISFNTLVLVEYKNGFKKPSTYLPAVIVQHQDDACENMTRADHARERPLLVLHNLVSPAETPGKPRPEALNTLR